MAVTVVDLKPKPKNPKLYLEVQIPKIIELNLLNLYQIETITKSQIGMLN